MKKTLIIILIVILILVGISVGTVFRTKNRQVVEEENQKRYLEIKEDIQEDIAKYVKLTNVYCNPSRGENTATSIYTDQTLIYQGGMDKEKLLDVDGKSYCKVRIEVNCVAENEFGWNTYLKCKDYEDEKYSNWDK